MWYDIVKRGISSPLSARAWCKQEGLDCKQFQRWKKKFAEQRTLPIPEKWFVSTTAQGAAPYVRLKEDFLKTPAYLVLQPIRRNLSIDSIVCQVHFGLGLNPRSGEQFLFISKDRTQLFALTFKGDGFLLLCKRAEGKKFHWPSQIYADGSTDLKESQGKILTALLAAPPAEK